MRFTENHEWISQDGKVGITDYAQKELGEIVFIELPKVGQVLKVGDAACVLESTKAASDVYAPVSGKVVAVHEALTEAPNTLNAQAETEGWLFRIGDFDPREFDLLMTRTQYLERILR